MAASVAIGLYLSMCARIHDNGTSGVRLRCGTLFKAHHQRFVMFDNGAVQAVAQVLAHVPAREQQDIDHIARVRGNQKAHPRAGPDLKGTNAWADPGCAV